MRRRSFLALAASLALVSPRGAMPAAQTPVATGGDTDLMALLRRLPDDALGNMGIRYANYDAQLAAQGIAGGGSELDPDAWQAAVGERTLLPQAMSDPQNPAWRAGLGFDLRDVATMAEAGPSDVSILLLAGRFDAATLPAAWEATGYTATETNGAAWYTLGEDNVLNFDDPLGMLHLGALSHLALLDDGTVAGTAKRADMERVLALARGEGASFGDGPGAALVSAPADLADGWIVAGTALIAPDLGILVNNPNLPADTQEQLATQVAQTAEEAPRMPPIALALLGKTTGAAGAAAEVPAPHAVAVVVPADTADAAMVAETAARRLTTESLLGGDGLLGRPWTDAFAAMSVETTPGGAVVIDLTPAEDVPADLLHRLAQERNLSILYWAG